MTAKEDVKIVCAGMAAVDFIYSVPHHPGPDEKCRANDFVLTYGGPAATAAVVATRLGCPAAFIGYLSSDFLGNEALNDLRSEGVYTGYVSRGRHPNAIASIFVKPNGARSIVCHTGAIRPIHSIPDFKCISPDVLLFDGMEPHLSLALLEKAKDWEARSVLDAGTVHEGTLALEQRADFLVASETYAKQRTQIKNSLEAARALSDLHPRVVVTLGKKGLYYRTNSGEGGLSAYEVPVVDTTGAGDAFHAGFAVGLVNKMGWTDTLRFASAAAALNCGSLGGRSAGLAIGRVGELIHSQFIG